MQNSSTPTGGLDTSFGNGGKVITPFADHSQVSALASLPDGKIVAAGWANRDFALARYNSDGTLDTTFGRSGTVTTAIGPGADEVLHLVLQPDGKIVLVGATDNGRNRDLAIARYTADGALDRTFGRYGKLIATFGAGDNWCPGAALQPDGMILVAGHARDDFVVARYTPSGTPDTTFADGGKIVFSFGHDGMDRANDIVIQPDGNIVAAGFADTGASIQFALARLHGRSVVGHGSFTGQVYRIQS